MQAAIIKSPVSPGPSAYTPVKKKNGNLSYTMRAKSAMDGSIGRTTLSPGPGAYNTRSSYSIGSANHVTTSSPTIKMGLRTKSLGMLAPYSPGPGAYDLSGTGAFTKHRGVQFNSRKSHMGTGSISPGPAAYKAETKFTKGRAPSFTMRTKSSFGSSMSATSNISPGPAGYNTHKAHLSRSASSPAFSMGLKTKDVGNQPESITPGAIYQYKSTFDGKTNFGGKAGYTISGRNFMPASNVNSPGPAYNLSASNLPRAPVACFASKPNSKDTSNISPGPGAYSISNNNTSISKFGKAPTATFQGKMEIKNGVVSPGPGAYSPSYSATRGYIAPVTMKGRRF